MKALVLAGGHGKRLRPLTYTIPKQLVPVANRPIISYVIEQIRSSGITDIGVIVSPRTKEPIVKILNREEDVNFTFITQDRPLGLAHAVITANKFLGSDPFIMYLGDNLIGEPIDNFIKNFDPEKEDGVILLKEVEDPRMFGVARTNGSGQVVGLVEKPKSPPSNLALVGVYIFTPTIYEAIKKIKPSPRGEYEITDAISELIRSQKQISSKILKGWWLDTGKKDDLLAANRIILDEYCEMKIEGEIDANSNIEGPVKLARNSKITNSKIFGPIVIGLDTVIKDSRIGPHTAIGNNCLINYSNIKESVIMDKVTFININELHDSIVGRNATVEQKSKIKTGIKLLVGDDAQIEI